MQLRGSVQEKLAAGALNPNNTIQQEVEVSRGLREYLDQLTKMNHAIQSMTTALRDVNDVLQELIILKRIQQSRKQTLKDVFGRISHRSQAPLEGVDQLLKKALSGDCNPPTSHSKLQSPVSQGRSQESTDPLSPNTSGESRWGLERSSPYDFPSNNKTRESFSYCLSR